MPAAAQWFRYVGCGHTARRNQQSRICTEPEQAERPIKWL